MAETLSNLKLNGFSVIVTLRIRELLYILTEH